MLKITLSKKVLGGVRFSKIIRKNMYDNYTKKNCVVYMTHSYQIKIMRIFLSVGHPRDPKWEDHGYLTTFRGINARKSVPLKYENNAQALPKQL